MLSTYRNIIFVTLSNVSSNQIQLIRRDLLSADAHLVVPKNTVVKKAITTRMAPLDRESNDFEFFNRFGAPMPQLKQLLPYVVGKVGMIFSNKSVFELKTLIL